MYRSRRDTGGRSKCPGERNWEIYLKGNWGYFIALELALTVICGKSILTAYSKREIRKACLSFRGTPGTENFQNLARS